MKPLHFRLTAVLLAGLLFVSLNSFNKRSGSKKLPQQGVTYKYIFFNNNGSQCDLRSYSYLPTAPTQRPAKLPGTNRLIWIGIPDADHDGDIDKDDFDIQISDLNLNAPYRCNLNDETEDGIQLEKGGFLQ